MFKSKGRCVAVVLGGESNNVPGAPFNVSMSRSWSRKSELTEKVDYHHCDTSYLTELLSLVKGAEMNEV